MNDQSIPPTLVSANIGDQHYHQMIDALVDYAIYMLDPSGFILTWNAGARVLKGYDANEVVGRHYSIFYPRELKDRNWTEHELNVARTTGRCEEEGWRVRKDGSRFWASYIITRLLDANGHVIGFSKITRDLSEKKRQEEQLRQSEERFRLLVEGIADYAIFMLDPGGFIISWNKGAQSAKGYDAVEIIGQHFSVFYPPEVAASGWPEYELKKAVELGRFEDEGWRVRKDGTRFWANVIITALFDQDGGHRGFAKITRDLTERRRSEMLEEEGRRITAFIAMLAHELRNPLAPITSAVAVLNRAEELRESSIRARDVIARQSRHLTRLVDDLLDMSRISSGKIHINCQPVTLQTVITEAVEMAAPVIQLQSHNVVLQVGPDDVWVNGDKVRLTQILSNLLHNAAKFTPPGGEITVKLHTYNHTAEMSVTDNGRGIDPARLPTLFCRFEQSEADSSKIFGGLGLGLSLAQELAHLQQGTIMAKSTGVPGEGSSFTVRLPRIAAPLNPYAPSDANALPLARAKTVLVVDDNSDTAMVVALLLETIGYVCRTANSGKGAIELIMQERPDIVLLDIGLPDMDGHAVAHYILANIDSPPPLIAVTGYGQPQDRAKSMAAGFRAHMTKPVDLDQLEATLQAALSE